MRILSEKLEAAEAASAENEREVTSLRQGNEKLESDLAESEEKYRKIQDSLRSAMADLNNV